MSNQLARINMIKQQLRTGNVTNPAILALYDQIPRDEFAPNGFKPFAYSDMQIPLSHEQRMLTPLEEGLILQSLALQGFETVLEIGTGSGFLTALLSRLCKHVISVDYYSAFTHQAQRHLDAHRCTNVTLLTGDGAQGWVDLAPFDAIVFTGAFDALNDSHRLQIVPGGKLFAIIGQEPVMQGQLHTLNHDGMWHTEVVFETNIPALIDTSKTKDFVF